MERGELIKRIREMGRRHGEHFSAEAFTRETGVSSYEVKLHGRWNDLRREAGLTTRDFAKPRTSSELVFEVLARLILREGAWPSVLDLKREKRRDSAVPDYRVIQRVQDESDFFEKFGNFCRSRPALANVLEVVEAQAAAASEATTAEPDVRVQGYVYMMRSGRRYKIGRTNSPSRRHRELKIDLPDPTQLVHSIETDDPSGIEAYWHRRFGDKRVRDTEFFDLSRADVAAFRRRHYM